MSATNRSEVRRPDDFYATPAWCVRSILHHLPREGVVLDPCAGDGSLLATVQAAQPGRIVRGIEIDSLRANAAALRGLLVVERDALTEESWTPPASGVVRTAMQLVPRVILTNPPYSLAEEFLCRALDEIGFGADGMLRGYVALLLRINWLASRGRAWLHKKHPSDVYVLSRRPSFTGGRTDATEYAWLVWGPGCGGRWSILDIDEEIGKGRMLVNGEATR